MKNCSEVVCYLVDAVLEESSPDESSFALASLELWISISNEPVEHIIDGILVRDKQKILSHWDNSLIYEEISISCQSSIAGRLVKCESKNHETHMKILSILRKVDSEVIRGDILNYLCLVRDFRNSFEISLWSDCLPRDLIDGEYSISERNRINISSAVHHALSLNIELPNSTLADLKWWGGMTGGRR